MSENWKMYMQGLSVCLVGRPQKELFSNYDDICGLRKISKVGVNLLLGCGLRTIFHLKFVLWTTLEMSFGCGKSLLSLLKARKIFKVAHICIRQGMYEKRVEKNRTKKYLKFPLFLYCEQGKSRVGKFKIKLIS